MSTEKTWGDKGNPVDNDLSSLLKPGRLSKLPSNNPLQKIKKNLFMNMIWGTIICSMYVVVIGYFHIWQVQAALGIVLIFSLWALFTAYKQYKKINTAVSSAGSVLDELKRHCQSIGNWMKVQQRVALIIYPISASGGFMLGDVIGSGKPVGVFLSKPIVVIAWLVCIAILVPACYYLARWLCKYSFGKHLAALEKNIHDLEEEK